MDWRKTLNAVNDRKLIIPITIAGDMKLKKEDCLRLEYDEVEKKITLNAIKDRTVVIPISIANDMELKKEDYLKLEYDDVQKKITLVKAR